MKNLIKKLAKKESLFVAYEVGREQTIIAQGDNAEKVKKAADATGKEFIFSFVPQENQSYIF